MSVTTQRPRNYFRADLEREEKRCPRCMKVKGFDAFYRFHDKHRGKERISSYCRDCSIRIEHLKRVKAHPGPPRRMPRHNAAGDAWCPNCRAYLPVHRFKPHPSREGKLWTYCRACTIEIDRMRYRYGDKAQQQRWTKDRTDRRKRQRRAAKENRQQFVVEAHRILRGRGFSQADIIALGRFDVGNLQLWLTGQVRGRGIQPAIERTWAALLLITAEYANGEPPPPRQRPHPDRPRLLAEMAEIWPTLGRRRATTRKGKA